MTTLPVNKKASPVTKFTDLKRTKVVISGIDSELNLL